MPDFSTIEDTLFVPMLGRIYASENFPAILIDEKALQIKSQLPKNLKGQKTQTQYTLLASAVRSTNMDRSIRQFMKTNPEGVIVLLGAGLETTFYRNDDGKHIWYEVDLPSVIEYRKQLLGSSDRDRVMVSDAFSEDWIREIRASYPDQPILAVASGLFYYFTESKVIELFRTLKKYGKMEILFDTVSKAGMKRMDGYMKQVGHEEAEMFFYVDHTEDLARQIGADEFEETAYYAHTPKKGLKLITSLSMRISDLFSMVKIVHLKLNQKSGS